MSDNERAAGGSGLGWGIIAALLVVAVLGGAAAAIQRQRSATQQAMLAERSALEALGQAQMLIAQSGSGQLRRLEFDWEPGENAAAAQVRYLWNVGISVGLYAPLPESARPHVMEALRSPHSAVRVVALTLLMESAAGTDDAPLLDLVAAGLEHPVTRELALEILSGTFNETTFGVLSSRLRRYATIESWSPSEQQGTLALLEALDRGLHEWTPEQQRLLEQIASETSHPELSKRLRQIAAPE